MNIKFGLLPLKLAVAGGLLAATAGFAGPAGAKAIDSSSAGVDPPSACDAIAGNLVVNCGLETGSFTPGWTAAPAAEGSFFGVAAADPHSGTFAAFFGALTPPFRDTISQSIATIPGDTYNVTFWLANESGPANQFITMFGGTTLLSLTNSAAFGYTEFSENVAATSASTLLSFSAYQAPSFFRLDDVSVAAVPEPGSLALLCSALAGLGLFGRRRKAV